jgi:hypothetical protein
MLPEENPEAVDKHEAAGLNTTPCELAWKVFNVAAGLSVWGKKHLSPHTELSVRFDPAVLLLTAG